MRKRDKPFASNVSTNSRRDTTLHTVVYFTSSTFQRPALPFKTHPLSIEYCRVILFILSRSS